MCEYTLSLSICVFHNKRPSNLVNMSTRCYLDTQVLQIVVEKADLLRRVWHKVNICESLLYHQRCHGSLVGCSSIIYCILIFFFLILELHGLLCQSFCCSNIDHCPTIFSQTLLTQITHQKFSQERILFDLCVSSLVNLLHRQSIELINFHGKVVDEEWTMKLRLFSNSWNKIF